MQKFECRTDPHNLTECDTALTGIGEVHKLTSAITAACDVTFKVLRPGKRASKGRSVPWWTEELTTLRKNSLVLRRRCQRTTNVADLRQERRLRYQESKGTYQTKLREAKLKSWKDFCTGTDSSNPWNSVYRYAAGKTRGPLTLSTLKANANTHR